MAHTMGFGRAALADGVADMPTNIPITVVSMITRLIASLR